MWASINTVPKASLQQQRASELIISELRGKYENALNVMMDGTGSVSDAKICRESLESVIVDGQSHMKKLRDQSDLKHVSKIVYLAMKNVSEILERIPESYKVYQTKMCMQSL